MAILPDDNNSDRRWLHQTTQEHNSSVAANLHEIKEFAYGSFERLDKDGNGFIETRELIEIVESDKLTNREKSFVLFLLNNQEQISGVYDENDPQSTDGISREDVERYFELVGNLL